MNKAKQRRTYKCAYTMKFAEKILSTISNSNVFLYPKLLPHIPFQIFVKTTQSPIIASEERYVCKMVFIILLFINTIFLI